MDIGNMRKQEIKEIVLSILKEERPGLWANIHAKRARGEKPARKGSKAWKAAKQAGDAIELNELDSEKIFHIEGTIIIDNQKRDVQDILSDVRALPGITVVRNVEIPQDATSRYFRSSLEIKVDPYPYIKQNKFDGKATLEAVANNIKIIPGVVGFKQTAEPYSSEN